MEFSFHKLSNKNYLEKVVLDFKKNGYVIIKNIYDPDEINSLKLVFQNLENIAKSKSGDSETLRHIFSGSNYDDLSNSIFSNVLHRGNVSTYDSGMIDVFNPLTWISQNHPEALLLIERLRSSPITNIVQHVNPRVKPKTSNLYIHENVHNPRCLHVDAVRDYFKIFLALSDQTNLGCGPFSVISGSHRNKIRNYLMCVYNAKIKRSGNPTDASFYSNHSVKHLLLDIGSIAICNQSIVHGAAAAEGPMGKRLTFVQTFDH